MGEQLAEALMFKQLRRVPGQQLLVFCDDEGKAFLPGPWSDSISGAL